MKELLMSRWSDLSDRKQAAIHTSAERMLNDTAHDRLRSSAGLTLLVAAYVVSTGLLVAMWLMFGAVGGVISIAVWLGAFVAVRLAVRSQADLPDAVLDERMRVERDRAYLTAFRSVAGIMVLGATVALIGVLDDASASITLNSNEVNAIFWALLSLVLGAPSIALMFEQRRRLRSD
jgi:hypothetical protein